MQVSSVEPVWFWTRHLSALCDSGPLVCEWVHQKSLWACGIEALLTLCLTHSYPDEGINKEGKLRQSCSSWQVEHQWCQMSFSNLIKGLDYENEPCHQLSQLSLNVTQHVASANYSLQNLTKTRMRMWFQLFLWSNCLQHEFWEIKQTKQSNDKITKYN